jgi:hypothetical protein
MMSFTEQVLRKESAAQGFGYPVRDEFSMALPELFSALAGNPRVIDTTKRSQRQQRYNARPRTQESLSS